MLAADCRGQKFLDGTAGGYNYLQAAVGRSVVYRFDLAFPLLVIATYLISLLVILFAISILIQVTSTSKYPSARLTCSHADSL